MQLIREFDALVHATFRLWLRFLPQIGSWLLLGWLVYMTCLLASATLGSSYGPLGSIVFVLGVTASVVSVIFAIHSLKPGLTSSERLVTMRGKLPSAVGIPDTVLSRERRIDVAILAIGPVLGIYAVWAIVDEMIRDGLVWNTFLQNFYEPGEFSIGRAVSDLPFYLVLGVVALALRILYARLVRDRRSSWWRVPLVFLEGLWVFATFFIVLLGVAALQSWVNERAFWREGLALRHRFLEWLPDIALPFDVTLPEFLHKLGLWLSESFLPGLWEGVALPLVWLAVTAMVFGWRQFRTRDLLNDRVRERADSYESSSRAATGWSGIVTFLTTDLRDKWIPLLHALRLIWRSGPWVLGAYLVLSALLEAVSWALNAILLRIFASDSRERLLQSYNGIAVVHLVVMMSLSVCLYAAAFDRGLADAAGLPPEPDNSSSRNTRDDRANSATGTSHEEMLQ